MTVLAGLAGRMGLTRETRRDVVRLGLQSAAAGGATYTVMTLAGLPHTSWAVISALFVVQQSLDSTLQAASGRLIGTVIGTLLGLATVEFIAFSLLGGWGILVRLVIAGLVMNAIAVSWPGLRYGVVAAAIIALEPSEQAAFSDALDRGIAILAGTVLGTVAALAVWPDPAYKRLRRHVRRVLNGCSSLLTAALDDVAAGGGGADLEPIHRQVLSDLQKAHGAATDDRLHRMAGLSRGSDPHRLVHVAERLWHALVLIDRVDRDTRYRLDPGLSEEALEALKQVRQAACAHLGKLTEAMMRWEPPPRPEAVRDALTRAERALQPHPDQGDRPAAVRVHALQFGLSELYKNLEDIVELLRAGGPGERAADPRPRAGS